MKKLFKKSISIFLVLLLVASCLPIGSFATWFGREDVTLSFKTNRRLYELGESIIFTVTATNKSDEAKTATVSVNPQNDDIFEFADEFKIENIPANSSKSVSYEVKIAETENNFIIAKIIRFFKSLFFSFKSFDYELTVSVESCLRPFGFDITSVEKYEPGDVPVEPEKSFYTVSFESNGGTAVDSQTVEKGLTAFIPDTPVLENYRFIAWYSDADFNTAYDFSLPVISDITLYAKWIEVDPELSEYTVTFNSNGGSTVASQIVIEGNTVVEPTTPTLDGYRFLAWYIDSELTTVYDFSTVVTSDITLYARWEIIETGGNGFIDEADPDVEIYDFTADIWDVKINEATTVTFTAEIFSNIELDEDDVYVVDGDNNNVGYMNDAGENGDITANDGVYTLQLVCLSEVVELVDYYAIAKTVCSDKFTLNYYRIFTDQDFEIADSISRKLDETVEEFLSVDGLIEEENIDKAIKVIKECLEKQIEENIVLSYAIADNSTLITTSGGYTFIYTLSIAGMDAGVVSTYQPYYGKYSSSYVNNLSNSATDGSAVKIENEFGNYTFQNNFDLTDVSLEELKSISKNDVILWHDHGGYNSTLGSYMLTGEPVSSDTYESYSADISAGKIIPADGFYAVTGGFFDKYLENNSLEGAFVYLATCCSGKDMIDGLDNRYSLVQSFLDKGADVVFGNSGIIKTVYNCNMMIDVIDRMCEVKNEDTYTYYSASEALNYARSENGNVDANGTRVILFPENNSEASNYKFEQKLGIVSGSVASAENSNKIANALVRVYDLKGNLIKSARTNSSGDYSIEIPEGEYIIKISAGNYKSAKMAVTVQSNRTTYNETFLLVNQTISTGFANGTIINSVTGSPVSGVIINVRKNWSNKTGEIIYTTSTNENGYYEIPLIVGLYTMEYYKSGYNTGYKNIYTSILDIVAQNAAISPVSSEGLYRIELSWGSNPSDLDSHLVGPSSNGGVFHLFYPMADKNGGHDNRDEYTLDLDDTTRYGPENTSIHKIFDGTYYFFIYNYSENYGGTLGNSGAQIKVYKGGTLERTFNVPTDQGNGLFWNVFAIENGEIIVRDTISDAPELDYATSKYGSVSVG